MKPHPGIRKTVKWGGAVVSVLLVAAWIGSAWRSAGICTPGNGGVAIRFGLLEVEEPIFEPGRSVFAWDCPYFEPDAPYPFQWTMYEGTSQSPGQPVYRGWGFPLWWFWSATLGVTVLVWVPDCLARRRARIGCCPKCHYDCTGLASGAVCPECGKPPA